MIEAARAIRCVLCDVDGVLTDGSLPWSAQGQEWKTFNAQDGAMIKRAIQSGLRIGLLSGRNSAAVALRAAELGISDCMLGIADKGRRLVEWSAETDIAMHEVGYIGDDIPDIGVFAMVGWSAAVADASPLAKRRCDFIAQRGGGRAAVAEILSWLLQLQGRLHTGADEGLHG